MCQFDDAASMVRSYIKFGQHGNLVVSFRKHKSDQYRQGTSVAIASNVRGTTCPVLLLCRLLDRVPCKIGKDNLTLLYMVLMAAKLETWRMMMQHRVITLLLPDNTHVSLAGGLAR
jgi:hypothetical protein